eukprot:Blabericola_migrator_1__1915@NODE_1521_length_4352_cov_38_816103_g1001_i0_p2_GENE_NODE_1521_length_4352_cov_38_816103_g1001_i0NODE_1521_length_4352_cov_38_816103_g1001_i0_p2_ORF_typecomplete_len328_score41_48BPL_LplA_LipB/PF03099_19/3_4e09Lip_prot_lig_C/PF10437_9/5_5e03Lip_prot_lig_C/PF10437_9/9_2e02Lip_prot_lig_C/PF10437_9/0_023_NODE_1521_length_4352_cov_38_816103_g1001_i08521835
MLGFKKPSVVVSTLNRIHPNLALEQLIIKRRANPTLMLWRNTDCVIIGRNQRLLSEVDVAAANKHGIDLARRFTGGGCVYQDLGNTVFTFVLPRSKQEKTFGNEVILRALRKFGIGAYVEGRNDLLISGQKFSGSAFQVTPKSFVHHGTLIRSMDMDRMKMFLTPHPLKFKDKPQGVQSVRSRVTQLNDHCTGIEHDALVEAVVESFKHQLNIREIPTKEVNEFSEDLQEPAYIKALDQLTSKKWIYDENEEAPKLAFMNQHGLFEISLSLDEHDIITSVTVNSDSLDLDIPRRVQRVLSNSFVGSRFQSTVLEEWVLRWDASTALA